MTTNVEGTTMDTVARWMWVLSLSAEELEAQVRWEDLSDRTRRSWHDKAVTIIDAAAPVWEERTRASRNRMIWDEAVEAVQKLVDEDGMIDQHRLIKLRNPYAEPRVRA